jgi:hypothetical protein
MIGTHDPSVQAGEDSSCFRPRDHCDRHLNLHQFFVTCFLSNATVIRGCWFDPSFYWTFHLAELQLFTVEVYST